MLIRLFMCLDVKAESLRAVAQANGLCIRKKTNERPERAIASARRWLMPIQGDVWIVVCCTGQRPVLMP
ncbi:MAG: hypothetical protein LBQ73_10410 [Tannerellaceae bacterium]|nr:hypothetical protein [Tannerellaceae bacterium]